MRTYTTVSDAEALDVICEAELGDARQLPATLALNPGLAALGLVLPRGTTIVLPDIPLPVTGGQVRLWGTT